MILGLVAQKGGVGKTTLAINLAVWRAKQGRNVLLVDGNKDQASAALWATLRQGARKEPGILCTMVEGIELAARVQVLAPHFDDIVIDSAGAADKGLVGTLRVANRCLTPVWPGEFDRMNMLNMAELVGRARTTNPELQAVATINRALTNDHDFDARRTQEVLRRDVPDYSLIDGIIHSRKAWNRCAEHGETVLEQYPMDFSAVNELEALARVVWA